jgi:hypothetical protein
MKLTYLDASILIAAFRGKQSVDRRAFEVLDDPDRRFVVSDFLRLEVLPKPTFHNRQEEIEFMEQILRNAEDVPASPDLTAKAIELAGKYDMTPVDSLHASAAVAAEVEEMVTLEKPNKPICRVSEVKVVSISASR